MLRRGRGRWRDGEVILVCSSVLASGQTPRRAINLLVVDENGLPVSGAEVTLSEPARSPMQCRTDFAGRCTFALQNDLPYQLRVEKQGFYEAVENGADARLQSVEVKLAHEQIVRQQVDVVPSPGGIDLEQISDKSTFDTAGHRQPALSDFPGHPQSPPLHSGRGAGWNGADSCRRIGNLRRARSAGWIRYSIPRKRRPCHAG